MSEPRTAGMSRRHIPVKNLLDNTRRCVRCGEPWPCSIAAATDAFVAHVRGEITADEMKRRILRRGTGEA